MNKIFTRLLPSINLAFYGSKKLPKPMQLFLYRFIVFCVFVSASFAGKGQSTYETIPAGSYIIDMGVSPQTIANGLKPYGLVYDLVKNKMVPVKWIISSYKKKDGVDFVYNGRDFKGGPFIIEAKFRTPEANAIIAAWEAKGVIGLTTTSDVVVPVFTTFTSMPKWTLDLQKGGLTAPYFTNAEIPSSAYKYAYPTSLNSCDDIFILPHADPTWLNHGNLLQWNKPFSEGGAEGWVWSACR